jgi:predicted glycogen debranching enzyme
MESMLEREWLETDGCGGFASGTVSGVRRRRYHALLLAATTPPTGRMVLVNGFEAHVNTPSGRFALSSQGYAPDVVHPDGLTRIDTFSVAPWPRWRFRLQDGTQIEQEIFLVHGSASVVVRFRLVEPRDGVTLELRPLLSGRDYHSLHHENAGFDFTAEQNGDGLRFRPYPGVPAVLSWSNAEYQAAPEWYRNFLYKEEQGRGLDCIEDLASPGILHFQLSRSEAVWVLGAEGLTTGIRAGQRVADFAAELASREFDRRSAFASPLHRAADAYLVRRGAGQTIVAGYPWFTDWGRDTFIALRGLCIATGKLEQAGSILREWAGAVSLGMLPNRFADHGEAPEYNSVDASLWYIIAVHDLLRASTERGKKLGAQERKTLTQACDAILTGYSEGTRHGIRRDDDGLLACGEPGVQLTWMDAKIGDWVVTPRIGKPVEVQALWLNALAIGGTWSNRWQAAYERGRGVFAQRFWNDDRGMLYDVVDVDHHAGSCDPSFRPNQVLAVGGLPYQLLEGSRARRMIDAAEQELLTPLGLRSLAPGEPGYTPRYEGGVRERDAAYHQGTVWPWLLGPLVEAWVRVRGSTQSAKQEARARFLLPLLAQIESEGLGHLCEIADAEPPHAWRGCPFQAWSLGEVLRLELDVLADRGVV